MPLSFPASMMTGLTAETRLKVMFKLISQSIRMRLVQSLSIAFTVCISVAVLLAFLLVNRGVSDGVRLSTERGGAQILLLPAKASDYRDDDALLFTGAPVSFYMSSDLFDQVRNLVGVEHATYQFYSQTLDASCCSATQETRLIGIDATTDWLIPTLLNNPDSWNNHLEDRQVIIGSAVDGFENGSGRLLGNDVTVLGVMAATGTGFDSSIIISADYARHLSENISGYQRFWELNGDPSHLISAILIDAQPGREAQLRAQLETLRDLRIVERSSVIERSQEQLQAVFNVLATVAAVMALVSLLQLAARYYSVSWERKSEFALYRALGATTGNIRWLICGEAIILTGSGLVCGLVAGGGVYVLLLDQLSSAGAFPFLAPSVSTVALIALAVVLLFVVITLLAVIIPLQKIARIEPSLALQQVDIS